MRQMRERAARRPVRGQHKVIVIEEAEKLTIDAQDAILKTIEEPGEAVSLFLITHNLSALKSTVVSRCRVMNLGLVKETEIAAWLCRSKGLSEETSRELAGRARGRPGAALRRAHHQAFGELDERVDQMIASLRDAPMAGALRLSESFTSLAEAWFEAETASDPRPVTLPKTGLGLRIDRGTATRLLEELAVHSASLSDSADLQWSLTALFDARQALLHNANVPLTLNVMMMRWLRRPAP
jgi:DNA polymerase-3 subunit delta'